MAEAGALWPAPALVPAGSGRRTGTATSAPAASPAAAATRLRREVLTAASAQEIAEMGRRGSLQVQDKAVRRIAEAAAREVPGVAANAEGASGQGTLSATANAVGNTLGRGYPRVDVHLAGRRARAEVEIITRWPQPAARVAAAVRDNVAERLRTLADLDVDAVEVRVAKVVRPTTPERRRVQ
ncbi:Asp23/Gls24 family envelope stress response protein [Kineococcus sp. SYSU DK003]|uniref:Asp23/Gls24 family envelope stress response protein n=1 Tax=Kineococcus sp. SYSU DK003 TaxID=3383124 RepID=UPI003D7D8ECF